MDMDIRNIIKRGLVAIAIMSGSAGLTSCMGLDSLWFGTDFNSGPGGPVVGGTIGVPVGPGPSYGPGYGPGGPSGPGPGPGILPGGGPGWGW